MAENKAQEVEYMAEDLALDLAVDLVAGLAEAGSAAGMADLAVGLVLFSVFSCLCNLMI